MEVKQQLLAHCARRTGISSNEGFEMIAQVCCMIPRSLDVLLLLAVVSHFAWVLLVGLSSCLLCDRIPRLQSAWPSPTSPPPSPFSSYVISSNAVHRPFRLTSFLRAALPPSSVWPLPAANKQEGKRRFNLPCFAALTLLIRPNSIANVVVRAACL
eukprot:6198871-Pleurochrysis_carterae.AAC.1